MKTRAFRPDLAGVALLALLALAGCGGSGEYSATASQAPVSTAAGAGTAGSGSYTVQAGDTLYAVSRSSGIPLRALIEANGLAPPYALQTGQVLLLPQVETYTVQAGDTLYGIARRFGVDSSELARQNGLAAPYGISVGQVLVLPGDGSAVAAAPSTPSLSAGSPSPAATPPSVAAAPSGEGAIAATPLPSPEPAAPLPPVGAPQSLTPEAPPPAQVEPAPVPVPAATPAPSPAPGPAVLPDPPARAAGKFIWPVDGTVISGFGPKADGLHNDGINIAAPRGAPVKAADNGVVAYAGAELRGFGNLILVKHQGDYVTAYAHNDQILVKRGDIVRVGETIARVGSSGNVDQPQLHFEIRQGARAIDPVGEMTAQTAQN